MLFTKKASKKFVENTAFRSVFALRNADNTYEFLKKTTVRTAAGSPWCP